MFDVADPSCSECTRYDLVVIGAGPHALALVTRLMELSPNSLISDNEHARLHQLHSGKSHKRRGDRENMVSPLLLETDISNKRILVIDKYGSWMERWDRSFDAYSISHLRSPLFFHMDPSHPDALRAFAHQHNRCCELHDISHIVDENCKKCRRNKKKNKSSSSNARNFNPKDRELFFTPSSALFSDFCDNLINRYRLHEMVVQGVCTNIDTLSSGGFQVTYECADDECQRTTTIFADAVVSAIGNTNVKSIPDFIKSIQDKYPPLRIAHAYDFVDCLGSEESEHACQKHGSDHKEIIPSALSAKLSDISVDSTVLVVGGGLTSAQMVNVALKRGFKKVILVMRSHLKIRQFDFSLDLMGRNSGTWYANFWMENDPQRRLAMIKRERNGGSITPEYAKILEKLVQDGKLILHEKTAVSSCEWVPQADYDYDDGVWKVKLDNSEKAEYVDQIWLATGGVYDIHKEAVFKTIASKFDIKSVNGLPVLNPDLQLHPELNFFVMSGYSSLVLGPAAANLQGGRVGAERIANKLWNIWTDGSDHDRGTPMRHRNGWTMADIAANMSDYFSALVEAEAKA